MKKIWRHTLCFATASALTMGCGSTSTAAFTATENTFSLAEQFFSARDMEVGYDSGSCVKIDLSENEITATDETANINGSTITITEEGSYLISGSLANGQILIDAAKTAKIQLILDNVNLSAKNTAPIYVKQADQVFLTLAQDSNNNLSVLGEFINIDENNLDAVIYAKDDLTLNGNGTLTLSTAYGNGITSKDSLTFTSGSYDITASGHGLEAKDQLGIAQGSFQITAGKDGLHCENKEDATLGQIYIADGTFEISAAGDGIDGDDFVAIDDGTFSVITGGGSANAPEKEADHGGFGGGTGERPDKGTPPEGFTDGEKMTPPQMEKEVPSEIKPEEETVVEETTTETTTVSTKGIKASGSVTLQGGTYTLDTCDDSIHSNGTISVLGGTYDIRTGDDGIHGETTVSIAGGTIDINKSYEGIEGEVVTISGGDITIVASDDGINATKATVATDTVTESTSTEPNTTNASNIETDATSSATTAPTRGGMFTAEEGVLVEISGGTLHITADGDGIDSNGDVLVSGGETYVFGPVGGADSALDYNGEATITGGTFLGLGTTGMAQNFGENATQGTMLVSLSATQTGALALTKADGTVLAEVAPTRSYQSVLISTSAIKANETYTLVAGDETQKIAMTALVYGTGGHMGGGKGGTMGERPEGIGRTKPIAAADTET